MIALATRACSKCGTEIPATWSNGAARRVCAECAQKQQNAWRLRKVISGDDEVRRQACARWYREHLHDLRVCKDCGQEKPLSAFHSGKTFRGVIQPCRACHKERCRGYYQGNKERLLKLKEEVFDPCHTTARQCPCGLPRHPGYDACTRCLWMDGWTTQVGLAISALVAMGGSGTTEALETATTHSHRHVLRACADLLEQGRVRRVVEEDSEDGQPTWVLVDRMPAWWVPPTKREEKAA